MAAIPSSLKKENGTRANSSSSQGSRDAAMSSTSGGCPPAGMAMLIGEPPLTPLIDASGDSGYRCEEIARPIHSCSRASTAYLLAAPKWKWLRVVTAAVPYFRAVAAAHTAPW